MSSPAASAHASASPPLSAASGNRSARVRAGSAASAARALSAATLSGYLAMNPGQDPEQTKAIYEADMAALAQREAAVREVHLRMWGVRRH